MIHGRLIHLTLYLEEINKSLVLQIERGGFDYILNLSRVYGFKPFTIS